MKNRRLSSILLGSSLIVFTATAHAGDVIKAANTNALNLGTSWTGGTAPISTDIAVWDSTITAGNSSALSADVSWGGIKVSNVGGTQNNGGGTNSVQITTSGSQITLGTSGIDMSAATQAMQIQSKILLGGNQSWVVANANTNNAFGDAFSTDLYFAATTVGTAFNFGGFAVSTSGAGAIMFTNGYTVSNGTLNVDNVGGLVIQSGGTRNTTLSSDLTINVSSGRNLGLKANSSPTNNAVDSAAKVNLTNTTLKVESTNSKQINQTGKVTMSGTCTLNNVYGNNSANSRLQLSGGLDVAGTTTWIEANDSATATIFNSALTGSGTINFQNTTTTRRADWSGDNSAFTGTVNLNGASGNRNLRLTSAIAGSASATWAPAADNKLEVDGVAVNLGTLNGAGTVTNSHATATAAISVGAGSFSGLITNGTPALGMALTKNTVGTLALTGANTYNGLTDVQAGTLSTTTLQTGGGAVTVGDAGTFGLTQINNGDTFNTSTLTLGSAGGSVLTLVPAAAPTAAIITAPNFTVNGSSTIKFTGIPVSGTTLVDYTGSIGGTGFGGLSLSLPFRISANLVDNVGNTSVDISGVQVEAPKWSGAVDSIWDFTTVPAGTSGSTANWKTSATSTTTRYVEAGAGQTDVVIFDDTATGSTAVTLDTIVTPVGITFNNSTLAYSVSGTGDITGTTGITKNGTAALTLATANTFSGGVQLNSGTLNVDNASALGSGALTIAAGTTLDNTSGSPVVATNAQTWNGDFSFTGTNDLTLGTATLGANSTVTVNAGSLTINGISGSGELTKGGAGLLVIGAASSFTGLTTVNAGNIVLGNNLALQNSALNTDSTGDITATGFTTPTFGGLTGSTALADLFDASYSSITNLTLNPQGAQSNTYTGVIANGAANMVLTKNGSGIQTLSGENTYSGGTTLNQGTLILGHKNALGTGALTFATGNAKALQSSTDLTGLNAVANNVTLNAEARFSGDNNLELSGAINRGGNTIRKSGTGALTMSGTLSGGGTDLRSEGGTLNFSGTMSGATNGRLLVYGGSTVNWSGTGSFYGTGGGSGLAMAIGDNTAGTLNITGGTLTAPNGRLVFSTCDSVALAANATADVNISGGTLVMNGPERVNVGAGGWNDGAATGAATVTLSGTGILDTGTSTGSTIVLGSSVATNTAGTGTIHLDTGGTLATNRTIISGTVGTGTFNFNGGTLKANGTGAGMSLNATLGRANVRDGGAVIDTNTFDITIAQALAHSNIGGDNATDGGLTKNGTGTLTLNGANTYTGNTTVVDGTLSVATDGVFSDTSTVTLPASGSLVLTHSGTDVVGALVIGGVPQGPGTYTFVTGKLQIPGAAYSSWASTNAPTGGANDDYDGDGVPNGVEYVLGGSATTNDLNKLPAISTPGGNLVFTFNRDQASETADTTVQIQVGTNLTNWPLTITVPNAPGTYESGALTVADNGLGQDVITLTLPQAPDSKKFARMNVIITP
jgi:fibronectin-binding autotransporter adhesin